MKRCKIVLFLGLSAGVMALASADNLTWNGTGSQTWQNGNWKTTGNSNVSWKDGSKATFTSSGTTSVNIDGSVNVSGLVFENYSKAHSIQGGTLNTGANATIEKRGDFGAVISTTIPVYRGRQDIPDPSDPRQATCVSGQRAWTAGTYGGLPNKNEGGEWDAYTGTNVVYWRNRRLSDISGFVSADVRRFSGFVGHGAKPYHYYNDGQNASVQFQYRRRTGSARVHPTARAARRIRAADEESTNENCCARVNFTQEGNDIKAAVKYCRIKDLPDGTNFDSETSGGAAKIWDERTGVGYWTVCNIIAEENTKCLTVVAKDSSTNPEWSKPGYLPAKSSGSATGGEMRLWRNRKLNELEFISAKSVRYNNLNNKFLAKPYNRKIEDDGTTSVQFKFHYNSEGGVLCIKVIFRQEGDDIYARVDRIGARVVDIERDWDDVENDFPGFPGAMAKVFDNNKNKTGWGIFDIKAANPADGTLEFPKYLPSNGPGAYSGKETLVWKWRKIADLQFESARSVRFSNVNNQLVAKPYNRKKESDGTTSVQYRFFHNSAGGVLCFKVYFRDGWDGVYARIGKVGARVVGIDRDWDDADMGFPGYMQQVYDGDQNLAGWGLFDLTASRASCAPIELSGLNELPENLAVSEGELKLTSGADFSLTNGTISGNGTLHLVGGSFTQSANATSTLAGKLVIDGTEYRVDGATGDKICGSGAKIEIVNGGKLITTNGAKNAIGSSNVKMYVGLGSKFSENNVNFNLNSVALTVDGGTCELNNAVTYIQNLTVRNGAQITECGNVGAYWFGRNSVTPILTCDGVNEVTIAAHLRLYKNENKAWNPDVQYLTVNTLSDLRLTGGFMMAKQPEAYYNGMRIRKTGPAKLIFDYSQNDTSFQGELHAYTIEQCVDEGTLELAKSAAIVTTQSISLYGNGSIQVDAGTVNAGGTLTVGGENSISIVGNGQISFDSIAFNSNARLDINGDVCETSFRVGTGKYLDSDVLSKIRINGRGVCQDNNGYLRTCGFGLSLW